VGVLVHGLFTDELWRSPDDRYPFRKLYPDILMMHPPRLARAAAVCGASGKLCPAERATQLLEAIIEPGDRVAIEGDNQKQADFLASALANVDPARVHDLHMVQSVLALPDHLAVFERGIATRLDFAYAGPQSRRLAELVASNALKIGAIHTYLEPYARTLANHTGGS